ncbi:MAG: CHAP domain-containing protein [Sandaracinaceae bacterium]
MRLSLVAVLLLLPAVARAQDACERVRCSRHGECMLEDGEAFCLCDDGYAAEDLTCRRVEPVRPDPAATRPASLGARIVQIASREGGRSAGMVGRERDDRSDPGPLSRYIKPGALWCTDFVAWVYRAAGVPFSGGYHGGWHITNNYAMRRWFQRQHRWVAHDDPAFETFEPQPGDYLRFDTDRFGHSAIVRYVANDTLYTVEGNSRGEVRARRYWFYKQNRRIDGFGIVTDPEERIARLWPDASARPARRGRAERASRGAPPPPPARAAGRARR